MPFRFNIHQKVQAVDELGRWEDAVIINVKDTGAEVRFPGCERECDRLVCWGEVRERVPPLEQQERRK